MFFFDQILDLAANSEDYSTVRQLVDVVDDRMFLRFRDGKWGQADNSSRFRNDYVRHGARAHQNLQRPNRQKSISKTNTAASSAAVVGDSASPGLMAPTSPCQEGNSLGNPNRGDRI
jgi:hypothetical protein